MNDQPLDDQITVLDYSSMLYDVRKQRNELRAELNIIIRQLEEVTHQRDKYKERWMYACECLTTLISSDDGES
jgi:hypothetical protein